MLKRLVASLRPPHYGDYVERVSAGMLHALLLLIGGALLVSFVISWARPDGHVPTIVGAYGTLFVLHGVTFALLRRGQLRAAAVLYASVVWAVVSGLVWLFGGLSGQHATTLVVAVLIAGFCAGARWGVALAGVTVLSLAAAALAETRGWLPTPIQVPTPWDRLQSISMALIVAALLAGVAMDQLRRAIQAGADREAALRATRAVAEARARQGEALGALGQALSRARDTRELGRQVARVLVQALDLELVAVYAGVGTRVLLLAAAGDATRTAGLMPALPDDARDRLDQALAGSDGFTRLPPGDGSDERPFGPEPALAVGVRGRGERLGFLLAQARGEEAFGESGRLFLGTVAGMLGSALERERAEAERSQAQRMEAVGRLASTIAHDFNNLLTGTIGAAELLQDELPRDDPRQPLVRDVLLASDRAALLTKRLLAFTHRPASPEVLDLGEAVRDFEPMLRRLLGERVRLEVRAPVDALAVCADRGNLDQILLNLAVNARDAMQAEAGVVTIALRRESSAHGDDAIVAVSDTGRGMDEETLQQVFEPFFTTKGPGGGTGIGLSTVKAIVHELGGSIAVASRPGHGATFEVRLPVVADAPPPVLHVAPTPVPPGGARVLLVEDNEIVRQTTERALRRAGYGVCSAKNGREALALLDAGEAVDLVLSDVVMPEMGGAELRRALARRGGAPPVLLMSGFDVSESELLGSLAAGEVLTKPFTPGQLLTRVAQALEPRAAG